ncbi:MAG: hypothetical protein CMP91_01445 [Gammaproteobacteria bacterium]|nr:hypothetical protein [Gammaproteobacteria bacterium]|tara:strand:- start:916 stop:2508 length:1593 start_codon:yes stop_codon:yes gene_type:complete
MSGNSLLTSTVQEQSIPALSNFLAPKYWPTWIGIGLFAGIAFLPFRLRLFCGSCLGLFLFTFAKERRYITETNIAICFPELDRQAQQALVRECFIENGRGLIETGVGWVRNPRHFQHMLKIINFDALKDALKSGKGVILLGAHYTTLDFSANLFSLQIPFAVTYRPHKNALFDAFMLRGRLKNCNGVFDRYDIRGTIRHLKKNNIIWYAPDQDYGEDHAVYAPFFGRTAATITAASRLARFNDSPVLLVRHHRLNGPQPYEVEFVPFPDNFPTDDDVADATYMNQQLEAAIRVQPAQYLWMHKRFKSQPGGKRESPYIRLKTPLIKMSREDYNGILEGSRVIEEQHVRNLIHHLRNDALMRVLPLGSTSFFVPPPMRLFDENSRLLREKGIGSVTVEAIYKIKKADFTAAVYFPLPGISLHHMKRESLPLHELAGFIAEVHQKGFFFTEIRLDKLYFDDKDFYIANPENIKVFPTSVCYADRYNNISTLLNKMEITQLQRNQFIKDYTEVAGLKNVTEFTRLFSRLLTLR